VHNPWGLNHVAGGSSSGSAAAVAAELCYGALGSDTGGSIRGPAACCSIVGLKPTYGLVSTRGVIPLSWSRDHVGPLTRTVADAATMLEAIAGYDVEETTSQRIEVSRYSSVLRAKTSSLRVGVPRGFFFDGLHSEIEAAIEDALALLENITAGVREISIPVSTNRSVFDSMWIHRDGLTHWTANQRSARGRDGCAAARSRVRAGNRLAQAPAADIDRRRTSDLTDGGLNAPRVSRGR